MIRKRVMRLGIVKLACESGREAMMLKSFSPQEILLGKTLSYPGPITQSHNSRGRVISPVFAMVWGRRRPGKPENNRKIPTANAALIPLTIKAQSPLRTSKNPLKA